MFVQAQTIGLWDIIVVLAYLLLVPFFYLVRMYFYGHANLSWIEVPFARWYLVALFFYRFFLKDLLRFRYVLVASIVLYLAAGQIRDRCWAWYSTPAFCSPAMFLVDSGQLFLILPYF